MYSGHTHSILTSYCIDNVHLSLMCGSVHLQNFSLGQTNRNLKFSLEKHVAFSRPTRRGTIQVVISANLKNLHL